VGEFAIGQGVARFEDPRLLRGGGRYVDDIVLPRMAFGYVLRSPHAHAKVRAIDTARAAAIPVVAVDFGYTETPPAELRADRLISHFDALPAAVMELILMRT